LRCVKKDDDQGDQEKKQKKIDEVANKYLEVIAEFPLQVSVVKEGGEKGEAHRIVQKQQRMQRQIVLKEIPQERSHARTLSFILCNPLFSQPDTNPLLPEIASGRLYQAYNSGL